MRSRATIARDSLERVTSERSPGLAAPGVDGGPVVGGPADGGPERVAGLILAAGGASRFGGDGHKLVQLVGGRPLVTWSVEAALGAGLGAVVVVEGAIPLGPLLPAGVVVVANPAWRRGQAGSLQVGLSWCDEEGWPAVVVGLGDQPLVTSTAWRAVAACSVAPIVVATYGGRRRNPVRLDRSVWGLLPTAGDEGARGVMVAHPEMVAEVACEGDPLDVDTLGDLGEVVRLVEGGPVEGGPVGPGTAP